MLCQNKNRRLGMLDDLTNLQALLKDSTLLATRGYIAGEWCDGEKRQKPSQYSILLAVT